MSQLNPTDEFVVYSRNYMRQKLKFKLGDRIYNIGHSEGPNSYKYGKVTRIEQYPDSEPIYGVKYEDGEIGQGEGEYYKLATKTFMKTLSNYYKKMTDADTQALVKAGYLNGDLEPTSKADEAIKEIQFFALKESLVERAKEEIAEAEKEENKG